MSCVKSETIKDEPQFEVHGNMVPNGAVEVQVHVVPVEFKYGIDHIKPEPVPEAAETATNGSDLYEHHDIKQEVVIGPEVLQRPVPPARAQTYNGTRSHNGEKPFSCETCEKTFTRMSQHNCHLSLHSGDMPLLCNVCGNSVTKKSSLTCHLHVHRDKKPFSCDICKKDFTRKYQLTRHFLIHSGEKPFSCDICDKGFRDKFCLTNHLRIHSGEEPFCCKICKKRFKQKCVLTRHYESHIGLFPCLPSGSSRPKITLDS